MAYAASSLAELARESKMDVDASEKRATDISAKSQTLLNFARRFFAPPGAAAAAQPRAMPIFEQHAHKLDVLYDIYIDRLLLRDSSSENLDIVFKCVRAVMCRLVPHAHATAVRCVAMPPSASSTDTCLLGCSVPLLFSKAMPSRAV